LPCAADRSDQAANAPGAAAQSGFKDRTHLSVKASLVFDQQVGQFALRHQDAHILSVEDDQTIASAVKDSHASERCELSLSYPI